MAIVGHWSSLAEAQKLVQSELLAGVIQETYEEGQLLQKLPVFAINSKSIKYNRESTLPSAAFYDIHEQIPWNADVDYATQVELELKRVVRQDVLDNFMLKTYKNPNDYRALVLSELRKGCMRTIEDKLIYGNATTNPKEFDGLDRLVPATNGHTFAAGYRDHDMGGASSPISISVLRQLVEAVKPKPDILLMPRQIRLKLSGAAFEAGLASTYPNTVMSMGINEFGKRIEYFDGIPIVVSDYLTDETDNTGGKSASSGIGSVYAIRFGQITDGGLCLCVGGETGGMDFFKMTELEELEDYDASGIRLTAYCALALGSTKAVARVHSIDLDGTVTA